MACAPSPAAPPPHTGLTTALPNHQFPPSFSTKFFDARFMATRGNVGGGKGDGTRTGTYKQAASLLFVGVTFSTVLWLMFVVAVSLVRRMFKAKTTHNEQYVGKGGRGHRRGGTVARGFASDLPFGPSAIRPSLLVGISLSYSSRTPPALPPIPSLRYTSIITLKEIVKGKVRLMLVLLSWLYIPITYLVVGALIPQWDWNDSHATQPRRKFNFHTPCYFMSFPPRDGRTTTFSRFYDADWYKPGSGTTALPLDLQGAGTRGGGNPWQHEQGAYRTDETVHCYTSYGVGIYCLSFLMLFVYVFGSIWMLSVALKLTYKVS